MPDWSAMFRPELALGEVVLRGTIMYLFLFLVMRFMLKRQGGAINLADLLVVVAVVDGAAPAFSGKAESITESVVFVLTILFWSYGLNWASYRFRPLRFLTAAPPLVLVKDGRIQHANMRASLMSREELMQQLREEGLEEVADAHLVTLEGDGQVSVVERRR